MFRLETQLRGLVACFLIGMLHAQVLCMVLVLAQHFCKFCSKACPSFSLQAKGLSQIQNYSSFLP